MVLAANEETGEVTYKEVVRTFVNTTDEITHVTIENAEGEKETIDSTPEHPFYVEGKGWVEASSLHAGMTIWFANGTKGTVEDISIEGLEEPITVYNFEVRDFHTYFVGESGVLVHNMCNGAETNVPSTDSNNVFPENPDDLMPEISREKIVKANGTISQTIQTSDSVRIRAEQHPLLEGETYNPRHHGVHYHVEYKVDSSKSWNNKNNVVKVHPDGYTPGSGTGFVPGEKFPGMS